MRLMSSNVSFCLLLSLLSFMVKENLKCSYLRSCSGQFFLHLAFKRSFSYQYSHFWLSSYRLIIAAPINSAALFRWDTIAAYLILSLISALLLVLVLLRVDRAEYGGGSLRLSFYGQARLSCGRNESYCRSKPMTAFIDLERRQKGRTAGVVVALCRVHQVHC